MDRQKEILDSMRRLCSKREYCTADIASRIRARVHGPVLRRDARGQTSEDESALDVTAIVDTLREEGFLSDARYALAFARDKSSLEGWGPVKIRYALKCKGIEDEVIRGALEGIDADAAARRMDSLLAAKYNSLRDKPDCRIRLLKYALGRGYSYEDVSDSIDRMAGGTDIFG